MYILIAAIEREIIFVGKFDTEAAAHEVMEAELAKALNIDIPENWDNVKKFAREDEFDIDDDSAWANRMYNYDWKIIEID